MIFPSMFARSTPRRVGLAVVGLALVAYILTNPLRTDFYNHFVWQADAFLHGRAEIAWPVLTGPFQNFYFQDVMPAVDRPGFGLIPYPPLPAVILLPFVAIGGLGTDATLLAALIGALNVGLAWRLATRLTSDTTVALLGALFYGFGTVAWYAAAIGTTWYLAHLVAATFVLLGITAAIDARRPAHLLAAGVLFGLGSLARLTTIMGAPFFAFVGPGRDLLKRSVPALAGAALPVVALFVYNLVSTGELFHPAYEWSYRTERPGRVELHHPEWGAEDPRYIPQNLAIMLAWLPTLRPECGPARLFDPSCPFLAPDSLGMSVLLTSPGYLLAGGLLWRGGAPSTARLGDGTSGDEAARRLVLGAGLAAIAIALADLAHFSQGWVQFGYRFSNDFAPFLLVLVVLGLDRVGVGKVALALVAASVLINAWGIAWALALRW